MQSVTKGAEVAFIFHRSLCSSADENKFEPSWVRMEMEKKHQRRKMEVDGDENRRKCAQRDVTEDNNGE